MTAHERNPIAVLAALRSALVQGQFYGAWAMLTDQQKQDAYQYAAQRFYSTKIFQADVVKEWLERERDEKG